MKRKKEEEKVIILDSVVCTKNNYKNNLKLNCKLGGGIPNGRINELFGEIKKGK